MHGAAQNWKPPETAVSNPKPGTRNSENYTCFQIHTGPSHGIFFSCTSCNVLLRSGCLVLVVARETLNPTLRSIVGSFFPGSAAAVWTRRAACGRCVALPQGLGFERVSTSGFEGLARSLQDLLN